MRERGKGGISEGEGEGGVSEGEGERGRRGERGG